MSNTLPSTVHIDTHAMNFVTAHVYILVSIDTPYEVIVLDVRLQHAWLSLLTSFLSQLIRRRTHSVVIPVIPPMQ